MKNKFVCLILLLSGLGMMTTWGADNRLTLIKEGDFGIAIDSLSLSPAGNTVVGDLNSSQVVEMDFPAGTEVVISVIPPPPSIPQDFYSLTDGFTDSAGNIHSQSITLSMDEDRTILVLYKSYPAQRDVSADSYLHTLLITGDTDLNPGDRAVVRRMERLGFTVTPVLGSELTQELIDSAQLALISSTSESTDINTLPLQDSIPIISWNQIVNADNNIMFISDHIAGISTQDTLELRWDFNGLYPLAEGMEYEVVQISTQPVDLGWIESIKFNISSAVVYTDMATEKIAACMANNRSAVRITTFLRNNTAVYLNDQGWHLFDCLVSWIVRRVRVGVSPTRPAVTRSANSFFLDLENLGIGCNWQLITSDFDWIVPMASSGRLDAGTTGQIELAIDWTQFSDGETKVKNNLYIVFDNPVFGNEVYDINLRLTATNGDQPNPRPPGSIWFDPEEIIVAPDAPFRVGIHLNTGDRRLAYYSLICVYDTDYLDSDEWNYLPGPYGFISNISMDIPGSASVLGTNPDGTVPGTDLHILTIQGRSTTIQGTSKIALKLQGPLRDEEDNIIGIIQREAEMQVTVADSLRGDMNFDGSVNIIDALLVARMYVGIQVQTYNLSTGDVNRNGTLDIIDALLIAQYYVGLITEFP